MTRSPCWYCGNEDTIDAGEDTDTLVLSGVVPGDHVVVVDLSSSTDQVVSIGGVLDDTLTQVNFENLTATGIGSSVTVTGSDGDNVIIGSSGTDSLDGGAGNDTLMGAGARTICRAARTMTSSCWLPTAEFAAGEVIDGGLRTSPATRCGYTGNVAETLTLSANP